MKPTPWSGKLSDLVVSFSVWVDEVLRSRTGHTEPVGQDRHRLVAIIVVFGVLSGAATGSFGVWGGGTWWQVGFAAIKVPLLLSLTFLLCLPSFYVVNTLLGLRQDFDLVIQALLATQAGIATILAALSPWTVLWYLSDTSYARAVAFNTCVFATASVTGQLLLRRRYRWLTARNARHRPLMFVWLVLYAGVGIQMAWILRPFIGSPDMTPQFFREQGWSNAYLTVAQMLWQALWGE